MIKIQGQYTLEDYKNAQKLHLQSGRSGAAWISQPNLFLLLLGFLVVLTGAYMLVEGTPWTYVLPLAVILAAFVLMQFYWRPRQIARVFRQQKELSAPLEIELTEAGFGFTNQYGTGRVPWKDFAKWKEDRELFLLYRSDVMFNMLPKRFLAGEDQVQFVRDLLAQSEVPDARKVGQGKKGARYLIYLLVFLFMVSLVYFSTR